MMENGTNSRRRVIIDIFRFFFSRNWHETFQYDPGEVKALKLGFFAKRRAIAGDSLHKRLTNVLLHRPIQSIKRKDAKLRIYRAICTNQKKEVDELRDMFAKNWNFLNKSELQTTEEKKERNVRG
jgi:hypothetical protein